LGSSGDIPSANEERVRLHLQRLKALRETGVFAESHLDQIRGMLADVAESLNAQYAEIGNAHSNGNDDACVVRVTRGGDAPQNAIASQHTSPKPRLVFDTQDEDVASHPVVARLGLRSLLFWPFEVDDRAYVLSLGWKEPRRTFMEESEREYFDLLVASLTPLLRAQRRQSAIIAQASTDPLTGMPNRAAILENLSRAMYAADRDHGQVAVLYIDLDGFKRINDKYGHAVGDTALRQIAKRLQSVLRKHEVCGRLGGDEFCAVISITEGEEELELVALRLLESLQDPIVVPDGARFGASASIGIAVYPRDGRSAEEILTASDRAMYRAKAERRGTYALASARAAHIERPLISIDAETFHKQFVLCYQPIVSARTGQTIGAEVLPRWLKREGMCPPEVFLEAARDQGLVNALDALILRRAHEHTARVLQGSRIALHVNVYEPNDDILNAALSVDPPVALEFSAEQVATQPDAYCDFIRECRAKGFLAGLSHFGCGDIALGTLAQLNLDFVKIGRNEWSPPIIEYAHHLRCLVIAEHVETAADRQWISIQGVDALQGFAIASPLAERDFFAWLTPRAPAPW